MRNTIGNLGNRQTFAKNLQEYMYRANKDRKDVCKDLDLKYSTFSDWCVGKVYPRIDKIELLANYFGIEKSDLVEEHTKHLSDKPTEEEANISDSINITPKLIGIADALAALIAERDPLRSDLVKEVMRLDKDHVINILNMCQALNRK